MPAKPHSQVLKIMFEKYNVCKCRDCKPNLLLNKKNIGEINVKRVSEYSSLRYNFSFNLALARKTQLTMAFQRIFIQQ